MQQTAQQPRSRRRMHTRSRWHCRPTDPAFPRTGPWMAARRRSAIVLGLLLVYVRELADAHLPQRRRCARRALGLPCLALMPAVAPRRLSGTSASRNMSHTGRISAARRAASRIARRPVAVRRSGHASSRLQRRRQGRARPRLRTPRPLAALNGERVIVVDCDVRAVLAQDSGGPTGPGSSTTCGSEATLAAGDPQRSATSGMDYIAGGGGRSQSLGLLMSAAMARLLQTLRHDYDLVLLDAPPVAGDHGCARVAGLADATLFCVRWRATPRDRPAMPSNCWRRRTPMWSAPP